LGDFGSRFTLTRLLFRRGFGVRGKALLKRLYLIGGR
jgi:hypothetical protein